MFIYSQLEIDEKVISHNFDYEITWQLNNLNISGKVLIKRNYYQAASIAYEGSVTIFQGIAENDLVKQCQLKISKKIEKKSRIILNGKSHSTFDEMLVKTFENTYAKDIMKELGEVDFQAEDVYLKKFIAYKSKKETFLDLLKTCEELTGKEYLFYPVQEKILVINEFANEDYFEINETVVEIYDNKVKMMCEPELKIGDILEFLDKEFRVLSIKDDGAFMECEINEIS